MFGGVWLGTGGEHGDDLSRPGSPAVHSERGGQPYGGGQGRSALDGVSGSQAQPSGRAGESAEGGGFRGAPAGERRVCS